MVKYDESSIQSLDWKDHIRKRPGMYIGKLGDGNQVDDGIYVLVKEIIDNSIDEHVMGFGKRIELTVGEREVTVRDYGRGIPLGKLVDCVSKINTGGKYDSEAFQKSVGLNGVGTKAVNALSSRFKVTTMREGKQKSAEFVRGVLTKETKPTALSPANAKDSGTLTIFEPDDAIFEGFRFRPGYLDELLWNYVYLNVGLTIVCNDKVYQSKNGLADLLAAKVAEDDRRYPILHFRAADIEVALTHTDASSDEYFSFVNGQYTSMGGTHQNSLREAIIKTVRDFYKKNFEPPDIRAGLVAAISVRIQEPVFESQTKTKLGSQTTEPDSKGKSIRSWVGDLVGTQLDNLLHKNKETADAMLKRIQESEHERKELAGIRKLSKERTKKANLFNKKLRDCRIHFNSNHPRRNDSTIFLTEGDSASGSITTARQADCQAVFSLRGKPLNTFGMHKKIVYENEELNLLQHALNLEEGLEGLRYNKIIVATDADVDGMHIRILLLTFFMQFFPEVVRAGHVSILSTPLFRVRNKKETIYCYSEAEKQAAIKKIEANKAGKAEITRFKGLGEISPDEFSAFIGKHMRVEPVRVQTEEMSVSQTLRFYMGKNTPERLDFIVDNLKLEAVETQL
jgi:topoisomerase IV subunit B